MKAANRRRSASLIAYSGCHCTPMQNRRAGPRCLRSRRRARPRRRSARRRCLHRLVVGAVDGEPRRSRRCGAAECPRSSATTWPAAAWIGLLMGEAPGTSSGMCWIRVPPSATFMSCWPPQMPSTGTSASTARRVIASSKAVRRVLGGDRWVTLPRAEQRGVHIEGAAGHQQGVDEIEIGFRLLRLVRQQHGKAGRRESRPCSSLAQAHTTAAWSSRRVVPNRG